ncbi:MAG: hypothetical protein COU29_03895 [Candidatus Magasanikbacteria bacterium CG10_big_fil_rev_8_21_14_0_10_36_32]|uniref:Uncharacterized protein n=1 Tax=Candidatus Magasanikbacteria bacterium CG10_big_fil_rev_8_21_14_0_10_36_32 TaxID=1974646 RepID=A0A2M6W5R7_9BACT|nr:MAG: hypothetical protein COU29_03895 [Candidatus Magasanikbacteria bacterium CG10_big_fil_rev_8_21_14_0_10_36_32]
MARFIIESRHDFDDPNITAEYHGHIVYYHENYTDDMPNCEGVEYYNDGLESNEIKSDPFETKNGGYITVNFLIRTGSITDEDVTKLYNNIDQSNLL